MKNVCPGYAIIRVDPFQDDETQRVTVTRVLWDEELAEAEVQRLNELGASPESFYFWQYTRVDELALAGGGGKRTASRLASAPRPGSDSASSSHARVEHQLRQWSDDA